MSTAAPTLDDIGIDTHNLAQLLDTLVEAMMNVTYPASRTDLTKAAALAYIARDMGVMLNSNFDAAHRDALVELRTAQKSGAAA
jgi:hypothetical protein